MFVVKPNIKGIIRKIRFDMRYSKLIRIARQLWLCNNDRLYKDIFDDVYDLWYEYFKTSMRMLGIKRNKSIKTLFDGWDMQNWKAMHLDSSEYQHNSRDELFHIFSSEAEYMADRMSFDRLFRTHWLFKKVYKDEIHSRMYEWYAEGMSRGTIITAWNEDGLRLSDDEKMKIYDARMREEDRRNEERDND